MIASPATRSKNATGGPSHGLTSNGHIVLAGVGLVDQAEILLTGPHDAPREPLRSVGLVLGQLYLRLVGRRRAFGRSRRTVGRRRILGGRRGAVGLLFRLTLGGA